MDDKQMILKQFGIDSKPIPFGNGHINDTYITEDRTYILQKINTSVFNDPKGLTNNVVLITGYLKNWLSANGGDPERETLTPIPTKDGAWFIRTDDGSCYMQFPMTAPLPSCFIRRQRALADSRKCCPVFPLTD